MGERDDARRSIEDARERMSAIAEELARRASPGFMKDRAREAAVRKTSEYRDRAVSSPGAWSVLGGILGATAGAAMGRKARSRREELSAGSGRWEPAVKTYEYGYASPSGYNPETSPYGAAPVSGVPEYGVGVESGGWENRGGEPSRGEGLKERASDLKHRASERTDDLKHRAQDKTHELKERFRGRSEQLRERSHRARERIPEMRGRASSAYRRGVNDRPLAMALGAIGLGFAASFLLPVTQRERQLAGPAKSKVRHRIESMEDQIESRIGGDSGNQPSGGYDASSSRPSGGAWTTPSPSSAPYYGEDAGVVEDTSTESGSRFFESSSDESSGRTIH